jgi:hypothetical protein
MKNTITVGVILFVIGALVGLGADRIYMKRNSAPSSRQMEQNPAENKEGMAGVDLTIDQGISEESVAKKPEAIGDMMGPSFDGPVSTPGQNSVLVDDQKPGDKVMIKSVTLETAGWVVIHDDNNAKPGHILGAHRFNAGTYTGQVELLKNTEEEKVYYAMLHADNGDRQFDYRTDLPTKDQIGNPVMMRFVATSKLAQ